MTTDTRPVFTWTNDLRRPETIHVAPAFKPELGLVFLGVGEWDVHGGIDGAGTWAADTPESRSHHGIWLDRNTMEALIARMREVADWSESFDEDDER